MYDAFHIRIRKDCSEQVCVRGCFYTKTKTLYLYYLVLLPKDCKCLRFPADGLTRRSELTCAQGLFGELRIHFDPEEQVPSRRYVSSFIFSMSNFIQ